MAMILVVDDDVAVQVIIRLLLERAGHNVVTAGDRRQGLALCQIGDFDLLFLDIFMPGMDGLEPCGWFASNLQKPFRPADLLAAVTGCPEAAERGSPPRPAVLRPRRNAP
nr:response regulator [Bradyrhizobium sp. sGM-13]